MAIKHTKTNNIASWTQADLNAQIALGNYPVGTLITDITLSQDWNSDHTITSDVNFNNHALINASSVLIGGAGTPRGELDIQTPGMVFPPTGGSLVATYTDPNIDNNLEADGNTFIFRVFYQIAGVFSKTYLEFSYHDDSTSRNFGLTISGWSPPAGAGGTYRIFVQDPYYNGSDFNSSPIYYDTSSTTFTYGLNPAENENSPTSGVYPPTPFTVGPDLYINNSTGDIVGDQVFDNNLKVAGELTVVNDSYFGNGGIGSGYQVNGSTVSINPGGKKGFIGFEASNGSAFFFGDDGGVIKLDNGDWCAINMAEAGNARFFQMAANPNNTNNLRIAETAITLTFATTTVTGALINNSLSASQPVFTNSSKQLVSSTSIPWVLSTITGINAKSVANTALYTVPTGKTAIITGYSVRCSAASAITIGASAGIGNVAGTNNISASQTMTTLTTTTSTFQWQVTGASIITAAAGQIFFNLGTGATGTSQTLVVDLIGYLV